jgi:hypothetical protein
MQYVENFVFRNIPLKSGAQALVVSNIINGDTGGFAKVGADATSEVFLGIAADDITLAAADNTSDGDFSIRCYAKGSGKVIWLPYTGTLTIVDVMNATIVYVASATEVAPIATTTNDVPVGTVHDIDTNQGIVAVKI